MKNITSCFFVFSLAVLLWACGSDGDKADASSAETPADTTALVLRQARQCARLYTNAYEIHKIITLSDDARLKGKILIFPIDMKLPTGERKIAMPIDVSMRASIDLSKLTETDVKRDAGGVRIILPDPEITVTASKIDNKSVVQYVGPLRNSFSDEELVNMARQGRDSIVSHLDKAKIVEESRLSAANTLLPMLHKLGFSAENTSIEFRQDFKTDEIPFIMK